MTGEEMKAALEKALNDIESLKAKNAELINEKKAAKAEADAAKEAAERAAEEQAAASTNVDEVRTSLEAKHKRELDKVVQANKAYEDRLNTLLIDNAINEAAVQLNISPATRRGFTAMMKAEAKLIDGEAFGADGLPFADYIKTWSESDEAKGYISAPVNTGAGSTGNTAPKANSGWTKETFNMTEFSKLAKENPVEANAISERLGLPYKV